MRLVLVGPPGSGKGTQAELLVKRLGLTYVGTGEILRDAIRRQTDLGRQVEQTIKQGLLVPDPIVNDLVAELFRGAQRPDRFVMDGYPRTLAQAVAFDALLRQQFLRLDAVVNLTIEDDEVVRRISGRWCCSNVACAVCYHQTARPPRAAGQCDVCGSPLVHRADDREETVRRRLAEFHKTTDAPLEYYDQLGLLRNVSALDAVETIFSNILKALPAAA
ncbi:MAG TPA: adenylate kinase [Fimbriiglobus sp.]|nr:adenylate kinase [Fimbriiglobus sp.]